MTIGTIWRSVLLAPLGALLLALAACSSDPPTGPVPIKYGRDQCDLCQMIISDPRYAAQIRGGPGHKAFKFDDIGDAIQFLRLQPWKDDAKVEVWVMDYEKGKTWLDARKAHFVPGLPSPMAHGFGAVGEARSGAVPFDVMQSKVIQRGAANRCGPPVRIEGDDSRG